MGFGHPNWWDPPAEIEFIPVPRHDPFLSARNRVFITKDLMNPNQILDIKFPSDFSEKIQEVTKGLKKMAQKIGHNYSAAEELSLIEGSIVALDTEVLVTKKAQEKKREDLLQKAEALKAKIKDEERLKEMECSVSLLPVCSCGHVFKDLEIELPKTTRVYSDSDHEIPDVGSPKFSHIFCPSCNKKLASYANRMSFNRCDGTISIKPE